MGLRWTSRGAASRLFTLLVTAIVMAGCGGSSDNSCCTSPEPPLLSADLKRAFGADPEKTDTDGDGLSDYFEITFGYPALRPDSADSDGDGVPDAAEDNDGDGLINSLEESYGTHPLHADTDNDGLPDGAEVTTYLTNPLVADTDEDGIVDGREVANQSNPLVPDADSVVTSQRKRLLLNAQTGVPEEVGVRVTGSGDLADQLVVSVATDLRVPGQVGRRFQIDLRGASGSAIQAAEVILPYDPAESGASDAARLAVFTVDPVTGYWEQLPSIVNAAAGTVTATTTHFSPFVIANIDAFEQSLAAIPRTCDRTADPDGVLIDVPLVIDSSGSMGTNDPSDLRKTAAQRFVQAMKAGDRAAIIDFDSSAALYQGLTDDQAALASAIDRIDSSGGTNIGAGVGLGISQIRQNNDLTRSRVLILLTDGQGAYDESLTAEMASLGIRAYTIGLSSGVDAALLQRIADGTGGRYYQLTSADGLVPLFDDLRTLFGDDGSDRDQDGLTDCQEIQGVYVLNLGRVIYSDPDNPDTDGDGLLDGLEVGTVYRPGGGVAGTLSARKVPLMWGRTAQGRAGRMADTSSTLPWTSEGSSDPALTDSDGDGLDDYDEEEEGANALAADGDGDGFSDLAEAEYGTDPSAGAAPNGGSLLSRDAWKAGAEYAYKLLEVAYDFGDAAIFGEFTEIDSWAKLAGATARNFIPSCGVLDGLDSIASSLKDEDFNANLSFAAGVTGAGQCVAAAATALTAGAAAPVAAAVTGADVTAGVAKQVKITEKFVKTVGYSEETINQVIRGFDKLNLGDDVTTAVVKPIIEANEPGAIARIVAGGASEADAVRLVGGQKKGQLAQKLGQIGEDAVRKTYPIGDKPSDLIPMTRGLRRPDGVNDALMTVSEVKNVARQGWTAQLKDYSEYARSQGYEFVLYIRAGASRSANLQKAEEGGLVKIVEFAP